MLSKKGLRDGLNDDLPVDALTFRCDDVGGQMIEIVGAHTTDQILLTVLPGKAAGQQKNERSLCESQLAKSPLGSAD
jgi:hypothetical protein